MAKKLKVGDCVDDHDISEVGERFWSKGWRIDKDLGRGHYRILYAAGTPLDGTVTWSAARNFRKSRQCKRTISEARAERRKIGLKR